MAAHSHWSIFAQLASPSWLDAVKNAPLSVLVMTAVLLVFFFICFIALAGRLRLISGWSHADGIFTTAFRASAHPLAILHNDERFPQSPSSRLYASGASELAYHLLGVSQADRDFLIRLRAAGKISPTQMRAVRDEIQAELHKVDMEFGGGLASIAAWLRCVPWLAALSPLVAWMETNNTAAPSEAAQRMTLLLGLLPVAIALAGTVFCQLLLHLTALKAVRVEREVVSFGQELAHVFDRSYVDYRHPIDQLPSISSFGPPDGPNFSLPPGDPTPAFRPVNIPSPPP